MHEYHDKFKDPVRNKEEIERRTGQQMRIYEAGSLMPSLNYYPFTDSVGRGTWDKIVLPSGVYKMPLPFKRLYKENSRDIIRLPLTVQKIKDLYQGEENLFLRDRILLTNEFKVDQDENLFSYEKLKAKTFVYPATEMVAQFGPGVHYFLNCRNVKGLRDNLNIFFQDVLGELDSYERELNSYIPDNISNIYKVALQNVHKLVIRKFKESLLSLRPPGHARTTANLPERKLDGIRTLLETNRLSDYDANFYRDKDETEICSFMIPTICEKIHNIPHYVLLSHNQIESNIPTIVNDVFTEVPPTPDKSNMTPLILTPVQNDCLRIFNDKFLALQEGLTVTRQMSNFGQEHYATTRGGKRRKQKRRKTQKRRRV